MNAEIAREMLPVYSSSTEQFPGQPVRKKARFFDRKSFTRRYGITLVLACAFTLYTIILSSTVAHRTEKRVKAEMAEHYAEELQAYKDAQREEQSRQYFLTGEASREAAINQAVDAVAGVISKLSTDDQKLTEASCILARVMSTTYPNSFEEVCAQSSQWMFYDGTDKTFSQHDRELAEKIVRPYMESGVIPNGLTADMVFASWTATDFVLRDKWEATSAAHYWRYGT